MLTLTGGDAVEATTSTDPNRIQFVFALDAPATEPGTVGQRLLSGAAQASADASFTSAARTATIGVGESEAIVEVRVRVNGDGEDETDETVVLESFDPSGATIKGGATRARATGFVLDDDGPGSNLALFVSNPAVSEGDDGQARQANFEVELSRSAPSDFTVNFSTVDGSAVAGQDYEATSGRISFVAGQTSAGVAVRVFGDDAVEASELFTLDFAVPNLVASASLGAALRRCRWRSSTRAAR